MAAWNGVAHCAELNARFCVAVALFGHLVITWSAKALPRTRAHAYRLMWLGLDLVNPKLGTRCALVVYPTYGSRLEREILLPALCSLWLLVLCSQTLRWRATITVLLESNRLGCLKWRSSLC